MANAIRTIELEVESRTVTGKNACRRLRASGRIPGNVYGLDRPPFKVAANPKRIDELMRQGSGVNTVFKLALSGENKSREAMIKELQRDPVSGLPVHIDFVRVDPTRKIQINVPIKLVGTPEGVKNEGGVIDFVQREVQAECLPHNIPDYFEVDISALHINQNVSVKDLQVGEDVKMLEDEDQIVAVVSAPRVEEEPAEAEEDLEAAEAEAEGEADAEDAKKGKEGESEDKAPGKEG